MSNKSDGSTASYYELPSGCTELQHLISHRNMNAQIGEVFRACYRYGLVEHSEMLRDAKKIKFYAEAEIERLEKLAAVVPIINNPERVRLYEENSESRMDVIGQNGNEGEHYSFLGDKWKEAPEWAKWAAMNSDGKWYWYKEKPLALACSFNFENGAYIGFSHDSHPCWRFSLEPRP